MPSLIALEVTYNNNITRYLEPVVLLCSDSCGSPYNCVIILSYPASMFQYTDFETFCNYNMIWYLLDPVSLLHCDICGSPYSYIIIELIEHSEQSGTKSLHRTHRTEHPVACRPIYTQLCKMKRNFFFPNRISEGVLKFASLQVRRCTGAE
jgi:hypothetical protein